MSTLHHIHQPAVRIRLGRKAVVALVVLALAVAALAVALAVGGGQAGSEPVGQSAPVSQTDPKYWVTHHGLTAAGIQQTVQTGAKSETDPKYWVTHQR